MSATQFLISYRGPFLFFILFAQQGGLPIPAAPWLLVAGALAADGRMDLWGIIGSATLGCLAADATWFYLGQRGKSRVFRVFPDLESIKRNLLRKPHTRLLFLGVRRLTAAKFLPFGTVIPLRSGALEIRPLSFLAVDAFASISYVALYVLLGFWFHGQLEQILALIKKLGVVAIPLVLIAVGLYVGWVILRRNSKRAPNFSKRPTLELPPDGTITPPANFPSPASPTAVTEDTYDTHN